MMDLELLSPAGDLQIYKAVVNAGADAVYFGGDLFGARAFAKNFSIEEASEAIRYGHLHGTKSYLTVNTLLKNLEIEEKLYPYLKAYVENGIDAFIVQDFGVFSFIKEYFPDVDIHCSTQMTLCNNYGAKLMQDLGATRIVTSRELSLDEIRNIRNACPDLEIEAFVHGALCICYSGQCLMSSIIGGRSGNRGRCAQPCRLPYTNLKSAENKVLPVGGSYILSPKDFNTINFLPQMVDAGVNSFKIEGRMKQLPYAVGVVSVYRKYLDKYLELGSEKYAVSDLDIKKLMDFGNRSGFTDLYLNNHNGNSLITFVEPSHTKQSDNTNIIEEQKIKLVCHIFATEGKPFTITVYDEKGNSVVIEEGDPLELSLNKPAIAEDVKKTVGQTGDTSFVFDAIDLDMQEGLFIPVSTIKKARRNAISKIEAQLLKRGESNTIEYKPLPKTNNKNQVNFNAPFVVVNDIYQYRVVRRFSFVKKIALPIKLTEQVLNETDIEIYGYLPAVFRRDKTPDIFIDDRLAGVLVTSYDWLGYLLSIGYSKDKIILDHRIYTFSNRSIDAFDMLSLFRNCIPYELSFKELAHRNNQNSQFIVYSRIPLMVTANCNIKNTIGCNKSNMKYTFEDRKGKKLLAACDCDNCINTIYNSIRYCSFDQKSEILNSGVNELRLDFTFEKEEEIQEVMQAYNDCFIENVDYSLEGEFTRGHLKRGVD